MPFATDESMLWSSLLAWFPLMVGCTPAVPEPSTETPEPALRRLTVRQYHNTIVDLYGDNEAIVLPSRLEPDFQFEGLASLGAALSATSPLGVERYEEAARSLAGQIITGDACGIGDRACAEALVAEHGRMLYRRTLTDEERGRLTDLLLEVASGTGSFETGAEYAVAAMLQSPWFIYRVEHTPGTLSGTELATRMAYFLWDGPPDKELLDAAEAGGLDTAEGREAQVDRMLADPRYRRGVRDFFTELFDLDALDSLIKDGSVYRYASPELWASAKRETLAVLEDHVVDQDADYRKLFSRRRTWVDRRLAALYDIQAPASPEGGWVDLPADGPRVGILGHASLLGLYAHPTSSSATRRGAFMQRRLLCHFIPPPPADVDTSIPEATNAPTRRERLLVHQEDPSCSGCHIALDNVGLALENFDGEGRFRTHENNARIDPSGELDEVQFADAVGLGLTIAAHPSLPGCITERIYDYAAGHVTDEGEEAYVEWLTGDFVENGYSVQHLMRRVVLSDAFRQGGAQ